MIITTVTYCKITAELDSSILHWMVKQEKMGHKRRGRMRKKESIASLSFSKTWVRQMQNIEMEIELETLGESRNGNKDTRQKIKNRST